MEKSNTLAVDKERLLEVATALLSGKLSNPTNTYTAEGLTPGCIKQAANLIDLIFDDSKLTEILK